jgi:hypothetical protein
MYLDPEIIESLRERYNEVHPLIFQRSIDHANSEVELFDVLDGIPDGYPIAWSETEHKWVATEDVWLQKNFILKNGW